MGLMGSIETGQELWWVASRMAQPSLKASTTPPHRYPTHAPRCTSKLDQNWPATVARGCQEAPPSLEASTVVRLGLPHSGK